MPAKCWNLTALLSLGEKRVTLFAWRLGGSLSVDLKLSRHEEKMKETSDAKSGKYPLQTLQVSVLLINHVSGGQCPAATPAPLLPSCKLF